MKWIVKNVPAFRSIEHLKASIPRLIVVEDRIRNAMDTFRLGLAEAGTEASLQMQDDIILCKDFMQQVEAEIKQHPNDVIQFFSRKERDAELGSRYMAGRTFMFNQCVYFPAGISADLLKYAENPKIGIWRGWDKDPTGDDLIVADYLRINKRKYWLVVPNLCDHAQTESLINSRRSRYRQSLTFKD